MDKIKLVEYFLDEKSIGVIWLSTIDERIWFMGDKEALGEFTARYKEDCAVFAFHAPEPNEYKEKK